MKKVLSVLSGSLIGASMMVGVAAAATSGSVCTIDNTGANSVNTCTNNQNDVLTITCDNNINVLNVNGQAATSGNANGGGNTSGGSATTGSVVNYNGTDVTIGASCGTPATTTTTTTVAAAPAPAGGVGAATPAPQVASLPETGSNTATEVAGVGVIGVGIALAVSQFGVRAYRRLALK